ncbi:TPA: hypothetical protein CPT90_07680 [Candidatus Gastranaerophilales bacterium HUM_3]|nr:MAG: hypothetical protein BHW62_03935 [Acinetobacter sp. CAG:196_36_41]DAA83711.1 MAG TPA: hypothetical protein CPT90_07680 [Candidatus Gastranaerophilales bacterium HUM_3]DAB10398.1 MAG TPA: hypothetical protein CPT95_02280 [Candidatus Gastranaerophilales bacterium HUM_15]DAB16529.1 MAG TPA: hypothetical protein CPU00_02905 [Candidatus Gastranaerophilales bacterium HUM_18]
MEERREGFYIELLDLLKQDPENRFYSENGKDLLRNKLYECAMKMDKDLIKLLLSNERIKNKFFTDVDGLLVFDKTAFGWAINNKAFLNDSYTRFKNTIGLIDSNEQFISSKNDVVLSFPYKDCVLEGGQTKEDQKRDEIYYNELLAPDDVDRLLAPKVFTNAKRYTKDGEEVITSFNDNNNLIIKGNNLLALSSILKRYEGKVKCIYIDPPYNTGSDSFKYNDNFNHSTWLIFMRNRLKLAYKLLKSDGYLFVQCDDNEQAYLRVLIDEIFNKDNFINVVTVKTKIGGVSGSSEGKSLKDATEFINIYAKNKSESLLNLIYVKTPLNKYIQQYQDDGKSWKYTSIITNMSGKKKVKEIDGFTFYSYDTFETKSVTRFAKDNGLTVDEVYNKYNDKIFRTTNAQSSIRQTVISETKDINSVIVGCEYIPTKGKNKGNLVEILYKDTNRNMLMFLSDCVQKEGNNYYYLEKVSTLWDDIQYNNISKDGGVDFANGKKPETLIKRVLDLATKKNDIILDFHLGSGTTCAVAHKMQRQYIGIEQLNYGENDSVVRLNNVINADKTGVSTNEDINWQGGGSFVYCELKELNQKYIDEIMIADDDKLIELYPQITESEFISYKADINKLKEGIEDFKRLETEEKRRFLIEILDKNLLYVNYSDIEDEDFCISEEEKAFTKSFYGDV